MLVRYVHEFYFKYININFVHVNSPFSENSEKDESEIESDGQMISPPPKIAKVVKSNDTPEATITKPSDAFVQTSSSDEVENHNTGMI